MTQELRSYTPTWREQLVGLLGGSNDPQLAGVLGGNDTIPIGLLDFIPGVGSAIGAQEGYNTGGLQGAAIGLLPASRVGRAAMKGVEAVERGVAKKVEGAFPGAAPDRTNFTLVRHRAPQGDSSRFKSLEARIAANPHVRDEFMQLAKEGEDIGRRWYDTEALRSRFIETLGEKEGDKSWREYLYLLGATSGGSDVQQNIRTASHYFQKNGGDQMRLARIAEDLLAGNYKPAAGYGNVTQKSHARAVGRAVTGQWAPDADPTLNAKPRGFVQSLMGSESNIAADRHFMRLMGMMSDDPAFLHGSAQISGELRDKLRSQYGKKIDRWISERKDGTGKLQINFNAKKAVREGPKDLFDTIKRDASVWDDMPNKNEYAALERLTNQMAREMNMTGPQFQASLWMGAAKRTKVDPGSLDTFENLFNKKLDQAAAKRGVSADDMFKLFATRQEALALPLGILGGSMGYGLLNQQD